jgi:hypothetical protein
VVLEFEFVERVEGDVTHSVSCVLVVAHRSFSKRERIRKHSHPNNKIIEIKIRTILCLRISFCDFLEV